tara:strand:- start:10374 stop:11324 length:951 start_codon:yes stop_codon:yes gene_type:complete
MKKINLIAYFAIMSLSISAQAADIINGKKVADISCVACHKAGVMGAPKIGDSKAWQQRIEKGLASVTNHALKGFNSMPAKGGNYLLSDQDIKDVIAYFLDSANVKVNATSVKANKTPENQQAKAPTQIKVKESPAVVKADKNSGMSSAMKFNRLMKSPSEWNPPPFEDGIHDPDGEGAYVLQAPKDAFSSLDKSSSGNRVDWVKSLNNGKIEPRYDRLDATKKPFVMDLNIVREVKGSMPNVVYPHKQHTQWLDCSNCHPDIFIPKKGANQISMAAILMGEKCGVCHGKVAFPVSDCRKCHSQKKEKPLIAGSNKK